MGYMKHIDLSIRETTERYLRNHQNHIVKDVIIDLDLDFLPEVDTTKISGMVDDFIGSIYGYDPIESDYTEATLQDLKVSSGQDVKKLKWEYDLLNHEIIPIK